MPPELEEEEGPDLFGDGERDDIILEDMLSELMSEEMLPAECRDEVLFGDDQAEQGQLETYHRVCGQVLQPQVAGGDHRKLWARPA